MERGAEQGSAKRPICGPVPRRLPDDPVRIAQRVGRELLRIVLMIAQTATAGCRACVFTSSPSK